MSANLPNSKQIVIHGFVTSNGQKMSKSLGNVINPYEVIEKYGTDAFRYYIARELNMFDDSDFTWEKFEESYNANLANGLGNLVSRVMKMASANGVKLDCDNADHAASEPLLKAMNEYRIKDAAEMLWFQIKAVDEHIQRTEPFIQIKTDPERAKNNIREQLAYLWRLGWWLQPFLPETSEKILEAIRTNSEIKIPLFPRK